MQILDFIVFLILSKRFNKIVMMAFTINISTFHVISLIPDLYSPLKSIKILCLNKAAFPNFYRKLYLEEIFQEIYYFVFYLYNLIIQPQMLSY